MTHSQEVLEDNHTRRICNQSPASYTTAAFPRCLSLNQSASTLHGLHVCSLSFFLSDSPLCNPPPPHPHPELYSSLRLHHHHHQSLSCGGPVLNPGTALMGHHSLIAKYTPFSISVNHVQFFQVISMLQYNIISLFSPDCRCV